MTSRIVVHGLTARSVRNIGELDFAPATDLNVIVGDNGQGKTSILEAIYCVATSRSFRAERLAEIVSDGAERGTVRAHIDEDGTRREQRIVIERGRRALVVDGKKPERLAAYALRTPVVVFHPGDLLLVTGPAANRRTLLDRLALFIDPGSADHRLRYTRALRERQRTLELRGPNVSELDAFEQIMATEGVHFQASRRKAAERLAAETAAAFGAMAPTELALAVAFRPGGSEDEDRFREELAAARSRDQRRKMATFGPQRDELELVVAGRSARRHASQGQQRLLTLAIKAAELACITVARNAYPMLLLDDFSSELDPTRTGAVYDFLRAANSQVFVTTTRPDLFPAPSRAGVVRGDWHVENGRLQRVG